MHNCGRSNSWGKAGAVVDAGNKSIAPDSIQDLSSDVVDAVVFENEIDGEDFGGKNVCAVRGSEIRSIIFVSVSSHALVESLGRVQARVNLCRVLRWRPQVVFRMVWLPIAPLFFSCRSLLKLQLENWQVRFAITHSFMMAAIFAFSVFAKSLKTFEPGQVAWVFASAGLASQLSLESTLFIGLFVVAYLLAR